MLSSLLATDPGASRLALDVVWSLLTFGVWAVAVARIVWRSSVTWPHGRWSKVAWILLATFLWWNIGPLGVPFGAVAVIYRTRLPKPEPAADPIPLAEGEPSGEDIFP
jgi:hypothetical protein